MVRKHANDLVPVRVDKVIRHTDQAALVVLDRHEVWVPLSQVSGVDLSRRGHYPVTFSVPRWLAERMGLLLPESWWYALRRRLRCPRPRCCSVYAESLAALLLHVAYLTRTITRLEAENNKLRKELGHDA